MQRKKSDKTYYQIANFFHSNTDIEQNASQNGIQNSKSVE